MNRDPSDKTIFRPARKEESRTIAELYRIAGGGVTDYIWTMNCEPGQNVFEYGASRYSVEDVPFGYKNCLFALSQDNILGMLIAFPMHENQEAEAEIDPVLAPYMKLEQYDSYYICAMAVFPEHRGKGIGTKFLELAERQAKDKGYQQISLIVFEQNEGALKLYKQNGFYEVEREPVVPHELIHYTGDALLMVKDI